MKTDKVTVYNIFDKQIRYLVPIFQRGYVWNKEDQWEPLWQDITDQIELLKRHRLNNTTIRKHFLGSIVLNHIQTGIKHVRAFEIIDGQQRLLTLQTLLIALRDNLSSLNDAFLNSKLLQMTINSGELVDQTQRFKVWPTNAYHDDLENIMNLGSAEALAQKYPQKKYRGKFIPARPKLVEAYLYFFGAIDNYINNIEDETEADTETENIPLDEKIARATLLFEVLNEYIQLVEITLEAEDDPQVIFETLNYRGVPLEPSDLIRNYLFLSASRQEKDVDQLYEQYWKDFDKSDNKNNKFWKEQEKQGRLKRSRLDLFFFHYVTYRSRKDIKITHLYQEFKDWWEDNSNGTFDEELERIRISSSTFEKLIKPDSNDQLGKLAQILRILDTSTVYPLLLWLCDNKEKFSCADFDGTLKDIESYLIRRTVCNLTIKNYNRIFLSILTNISKELNPTGSFVRNELLSLKGDSGVWPDDEKFKSSLLFDPLYQRLKPRRVNLILTLLEMASRTNKQESTLANVSLSNTLTVEHIMPQYFKPDEWPYPDTGADQQGQILTRRTLLHSLGNLTLLTQPLNSDVSNGPFHDKRPEITTKSLLVLNSYLQGFSDNDVWDEDTILSRAKSLADQALKLWEYPESISR